MPEHVLLLIKKVDNIEDIVKSDIVEKFTNDNNADVDIDDNDNRYRAIHKEIKDYDFIVWTNDVRTLNRKIDIEKLLENDDIVVSKDKHLFIVRGNDNVRKLMFHWSQSTKDIFKTQRWRNEVTELDTLNVVQNSKGENSGTSNTDMAKAVNGVIETVNTIDERWLLFILIVLLIIVATKL